MQLKSPTIQLECSTTAYIWVQLLISTTKKFSMGHKKIFMRVCRNSKKHGLVTW